MAELQIEATNESIARHYAGVVDALVIDRLDAADIASLSLPALATATLMNTLEDRVALARDVLDFARELASSLKPARRVYGVV
jgi:LPPG:FO 2-phospho-L-lactate transferase